MGAGGLLLSVSVLTPKCLHFDGYFFLQVILCEDTISSQPRMDDVLTHELIHAYDFCRVKYEKDNLRHLACTEVNH